MVRRRFPFNLPPEVAEGGTLVFEAGEDMHNIVITIIDDDIHEKDEDFFVDLKNPTSTGKSAQLPRLEINDCSVREIHEMY